MTGVVGTNNKKLRPNDESRSRSPMEEVGKL